MSDLPRLDIVVVNWNSGNQLGDCLATVARANRTNFVLDRIVVVDNASSDGSADDLPDVGARLVLIRNEENRGFAAACNQGAHESRAKYILFLNPDVRLFDDSLVRSVWFMEQPSAEQVGICGIQLINDEGQIAHTCARFPTPAIVLARILGLERCFPAAFPGQRMTEWDHRDSRQVDQVIGAFFLVRRSLFESLEGFDERFFVYFEEVDFSYRASQLGWSSFYLAEAQAHHREHGTTEQVKALRMFYSLRSRIQYVQKHFRKPASIGLTLATLLAEPFPRLLFTMWARPPRELLDVIGGYAMLWSNVPQLLRPKHHEGDRTCASSS